MKKSFKIFFFLFVGMVLFAHCKKEAEPPQPEITITRPAPNASFTVKDTIAITLTITSMQATVTLYISLVNDVLEPVPFTATVTIPDFPAGEETTIAYVLNDDKLESGYYKLKISASDEGGTVYAYRRIYITGLPREFMGFFIISSENSSQTGVEKFDAAFNPLLKRILQGNYAGSDINNIDRLLFVAGKNLGNFTAMTTDTLATQWEVPIIPSPGQPYFTFVNNIERMVYTGFYDGRVEGFNFDGNLSFSAATTGATIPVGACRAGDLLVVLSVSRSNILEHWAETYFIPSGALNTKTAFWGTPLHIKTLDRENVLLFGNDTEGNLTTRLFDPLTGLLSDPYQPFGLPQQEMLCADDMDSRRTLLGLADGIYLYTYQESITRIVNTVTPRLLRRESLSHTIWAVTTQDICLFADDGTLISQTAYPKPVLNLLLQYNK